MSPLLALLHWQGFSVDFAAAWRAFVVVEHLLVARSLLMADVELEDDERGEILVEFNRHAENCA